jgi:3-oxoadipate CoA-transferase alpha subunit
MRAGGAGIPAFFTPTAAGTKLAEGKEQREFAGRRHVLEEALSGDLSLIEAWKADRWGNLTYRACPQFQSADGNGGEVDHRAGTAHC